MWGSNFRPRTQGLGYREQPQYFDYGHAREPVKYDREPQPPRRFDYESEEEDDDEEIIPLPEDLARKFGKLTCELCLCTLPSVKQANMHYEGKQHEKRVMRYLEEWSTATNKNIPKCWLRLVCKRKVQTASKQPHGCDEKFCSVCNIVLTSKVVANQHYSGRSHNTALKLYKGKNAPNGPNANPKSQFVCDICNVVTSCQEHLENHMMGSKHKKVLQRLKEAEFLEMYGGHEEEEQEEEEEEPEYNVIQSGIGVQYECVHCSWRGQPADFETHKEELKHISAVAAEEARKKTEPNDDDDDDEANEYTDVTDLFCKLCNVQLTSKKEVAQHVKSRDHLVEMNLRKKQVMMSMDDPQKTVLEEEHKCELCLMKFPSKSMYDAHLQWKRHVKKLASKIQSESKHRCELCQMDFYSEKMYDAHLTTKRHRNNEQWLQKNQIKNETDSKKSVDGKVSDKDDISSSKGDGKDTKTKGRNTTVSNETELKNRAEANETLENSSKTGSGVEGSKTNIPEQESLKVQADLNAKENNTSKDKTPGDNKPDKTAKVGGTSEENEIFKCEVCEIAVSGQLPYEQHLISTRHILQCSLKNATVREEPNAHAKSVAKANKPLFCKLCHVTSLTKYQHELHLGSKKHKDAVTKLEVLKFEPKLKMTMNLKPIPTTQNAPVVERNFENQNFDRFENSRNQPVFSDKPFYMQQSSRDLAMSHNVNPQPFRQEHIPVAANFGALGPSTLPAAAPRPFAPPPPLLAEGQRFAPPHVREAHYLALPPAGDRFVPARPPVPSVQNPQPVGRLEAGTYSGKIAADPPPIRRSTYSCKDCGAAFISGVEYKHHANTCKKKDRTEERKDLIRKSSNLKTDETYHCEACDVEYSSYRAFLEHKASVEHEANIEHLREFGKRLKPVRQETRKQEYDHWLSGEQNERGLQNSKSFECKRCDVSFYSQQAFNMHMNSTGHLRKPVTYKREIVTYKQEMRSPMSDRREQSSYEGSRSRDLSLRGQRKHMGSPGYSDSDSEGMDLMPQKKTRRPYECTLCDKIYSSEYDYKDHLKSKQHKRSMCLYECGDCSATFSSKNDLANHMCDLGKIRRVEKSDVGGKWLQNWSSSERGEHSRSHNHRGDALEDDDDYEISRNLLLLQNESNSLLSTFSFKRETYEVMSDSRGMQSFNY